MNVIFEPFSVRLDLVKLYSVETADTIHTRQVVAFHKLTLSVVLIYNMYLEVKK
jgi:hypothetical protein